MNLLPHFPVAYPAMFACNGIKVLQHRQRLLLPSRRYSATCRCQGFEFLRQTREPGVRRNRESMKRDAQELLQLVKGLCEMPQKHFQAVTNMLAPDQADAIGIAMRLPKASPGRARQIKIVAKLFRETLDNDTMVKLQRAVYMSETGRGAFVDDAAQQLRDAWVSGLLTGDKAVEEQLQQLPPEWGLDLARVQSLVEAWREVQEGASSQQQQQQQQVAVGANAVDGLVPDEELLQLLARRARRAQALPGGSSGSPTLAAGTSSGSIRAQLQNLLRPLAVRSVALDSQDKSVD